MLHECGDYGDLIRSISCVYDGSRLCARLVVEWGNILREGGGGDRDMYVSVVLQYFL